MTTPPLSTTPYSQEAEEAVLGAVLVNPDAYVRVAASLKPEDFYVLRNQHVWAALERLHRRGSILDYLTVQEELRTANVLKDIGGPAFLTQLTNSAVSSMYAEVYGELVRKASIRRKYLHSADVIRGLALDQTSPVEKLEADALAQLVAIQSVRGGGMVTLRDAMDKHARALEDAMQMPSQLLGVPSALSALNTITRGYRKKKLYVSAGRPGMGKTSHLLTEASEAARHGLKVAIFTMEMPEEEVTNSIIAAEMMLEADRLETGDVTSNEYARYLQASARVDNWDIFIDDTSGITPQQIRLKCLRIQQEFGLDMVVVDYIQLMSGGNEVQYGTRDQEIGYFSRSLKALAKELNVPVLAAAQLSREVEKRQDKRPMLSDLRESGNIENDADVVLLFYREDYYTGATNNPISKTEIGIAKHRGGKTGVVYAGFYRAFKKFVELERNSANV